MSSKLTNMSHHISSGCSSPQISSKSGAFPLSNRSFKDGSTRGKIVPHHSSSNPKSKDFSANHRRSPNAMKQRLSANASQKGKTNIFSKRDKTEITREFPRTQRLSSSSKSTDSDSVSDSDSDLSSSSISSSSDSNSSRSSYSSSLSNSYDKGFTSRNASKTKGRNLATSNAQLHTFKHSSASDVEIRDFNLKELNATSTLSLSEYQKPSKHANLKHSNTVTNPLRSQTHCKDEVFKFSDDSKKIDRSTKIHVGNLTRNILRSHLYEIFSNYGKIRRLELPLDPVSTFNQGYAYIDYDSSQSAIDAQNFMDEGYLDGQLISVQLTYSLKRNDSVRVSGRTSLRFSPTMHNRSPHLRRSIVSEYRRGRSPVMRRAPARFRRRKRDHSFSSSRSRTRSSSIKHRSAGKRYFSKHLPNTNYRKYSHSSSPHKYSHSQSGRAHRKHKRTSTSSSFSTSSESR